MVFCWPGENKNLLIRNMRAVAIRDRIHGFNLTNQVYFLE
jgi:hypothetical protein